MAESSKAYVGFKNCGCPVAVMVAGYDSERGEKAELKRWIANGRRIEVMTVGEARALPHFLNCPHSDASFKGTDTAELAELVKAARA